MNKDIIYIDVEDDVTAIIGKIKASSERIVALVPPKRIGVLQSAVNLRLLERMARTANKHLVIVTNNQALVSLSAVAGIPVAKNLQSKPEIAEIPALSIDDDDDIIDGSQLPVGELQKTADVVDDENSSIASAISSIDIDEEKASIAPSDTMVPKRFNQPKNNKNKVKVPNFNSFRKKLFIGIAALIPLIAFFIWATVFAPAAKIIITARTTPTSVNATVTLGGNAATDVSKGLIQSLSQQIKKDVSVEFTATGSKDIGNKATGTMTVTRTSISSSALSVPVGTSFSSGNLVFYSTQAMTLDGTQVGLDGNIQDSATVTVTASNPGETYNLSARSYQSNVSGISSGGSDMIGGTTKIATTVTAEDVQKASALLVEEPSDQIKAQLIKLFTSSAIVIDDSFTVSRAAPVSTPAIDAEATGKAKLTSSITYSILAIAKSDIQLYLKANLEKQLTSKDTQQVYDDGASTISLSGFTKTDNTSTVNIIGTGQIGPKINENDIKQQIKGKIYGDVQAILQKSLPANSDVDVKFSFFWVRTVPNDTNKITVEFKVQND